MAAVEIMGGKANPRYRERGEEKRKKGESLRGHSGRKSFSESLEGKSRG